MMNFKLVLIIIIIIALSLDASRLRRRNHTHKRMQHHDARRLQGRSTFTGWKRLRELRSRQSPWEVGSYGKVDAEDMLAMQRVVLKNTSYRWYSTEIPYEIHSDFTYEEKQVIEGALKDLATRTCIRPRPRNNSDKESVFFVQQHGKSCYSWIGSHHIIRQQIYLDPRRGCVTDATVKHEFLHVLGMFHTQSATDRDEYVEVIWGNILRGAENNFVISPWPTIRYGLPYDYDSIMHYSGYAFSRNGRPTMVSKTPGISLPRKYDLSPTDIIMVNKMYGCDDDNEDSDIFKVQQDLI